MKDKIVTMLYVPWKVDFLGGVDVVVYRTAQWMSRCGNVVIGYQEWFGTGDELDIRGQRAVSINLPNPPESHGIVTWGKYILTLVRRMTPTWWTLRRLNVRIINAHYPTRNLLALAFVKAVGLWRGRLVLSFHGSDVAELSDSSLVWKLIVRASDSVTACSAALAEKLRKLELFRNTDVRVIHNGIDVDEFRDVARGRDTVTAMLPKPYVLNVGNYVVRKGQDILLQSFRGVAEEVNDCHLVFAGGTYDGSWLSSLRSEAKRLGVEHRVTFLENVDHAAVPSLMKGAVCLAHTPRDEPFGLVLIEAASVGLPVITVGVGGVAEVVLDQDTGLVVSAGDGEALRNGIVRLLKDDALRARMASRALERVRTHFSVDAMGMGYARACQAFATSD